MAPQAELLPMYDTPPHLAEDTRRMRAAAPYCGLGFKKARLPESTHQRLRRHLRDNADRFRTEGPIEYIGNQDPAVIPALYFEDKDFNRSLSEELQPLHEEWSGLSLVESACYGIRIYQRGTFLYNHVDRTETHIISSTICIDHRLVAPWPIFVEDIEGRGHQINLAPGEMVFYEGAKLVHGRAYPLQGDHYASLFVHYRPASRGS